MPRAPTTMTHPETGEMLRRGVRTVTVTYRGLQTKIRQQGWSPARGSDGVFVGADMVAADKALAKLKVEARLETARKVKAIRERLKLSQRQAGLILGGGPRSFQKYESGEIEPSEPMLNLLTVLDREPSLLKVLTAA